VIQDLSLAGKQLGMSVSQSEGGTRSGLLWEVVRILDELKDKELPQILLMENVPEVVGSKNVKDFRKLVEHLDSLGYTSYFEILNAKDYGIPQNRRRCFMLSVLDGYGYTFPIKMKLKYRLKDFLEKSVDEKYYLSEEKIAQISSWGGYENPLKDIERERETIGTLTTHAGKDSNGMKLVGETIHIKNNTKKGYLEAKDGDGIDINGASRNHRATVQKQIVSTIKTGGGQDLGVVIDENKRK